MNIDKHSEKGLATLTDMGTVPENWGLTPIKWEKKRFPTKVWILCPKCDGNGETWVYKGKFYSLWKAADLLKTAASPSYLKEKGAVLQECDCPWHRITRSGREYYYRIAGEGGKTIEGFRNHYSRNGRGLVESVEQIERTVGTVLWANGTIFDSRFGDNEKNQNYSADGCQLCAKRIPSGRFVPVNGKDASGNIHGLWAGEDCARKFFGVKAFKPEQVIVREAR